MSWWKGNPEPEPPVASQYPRLGIDEAPTDVSPPDQWFDWLAAHSSHRIEWSEAAARAYRQKWNGSRARE